MLNNIDQNNRSGDGKSNRPRNSWGEFKIGFAEGTGSGIWTIGHQIGHQQRKSTAKELGGAPAETIKPRIRGPGRANAADRKSLGRGKISEGGA